MNENKRVRFFLVVLLETLMTSFEYNCWNVATVHNYGTYDRHDFSHWPADSDSLPAAPGHWHRTAEPRNWIIFSRRRPLEPTQIFRVHFVPARRAQPADSDYFSRPPPPRSPAARPVVSLHKSEALSKNPGFYFIYYILKIGLKKY